ncbi:MAG: YfcL family protein [Alishewanella sp.]|uniref:YfcL family protein n=1 Tax=Alishewanella sp. HL-SH06 TaxID=3461144 RepID=UPI00275D2215|nr:YfcL family protein [Alishewanella sp.]MDP5036073.1 YfcL family protein [Alishewanella sp.]MDP5185731.1 YfcL family protein [Alishewanella sp.]
MSIKMQQQEHTEQFIEQAAAYFDQLVPIATDDELFAAGYLRGHVDLVVGTLQVTEQPFHVSDIVAQVEQSLAQAISGGELTEQDQQQVRAVWQQLQSSCETSSSN